MCDKAMLCWSTLSLASTRNLCMLRSKLRCDVLWRCCKLHRKYQGKRGSRSYFVALASTEEAVPCQALLSGFFCGIGSCCCHAVHPFILSSPSCFSKGLKNRKSVFPKAVWAIVSISLLASGDAAGFILDFLAVTKLKVCVEPSCPRRSLQASL